MSERNIRLELEYFGLSFAGWQTQKDQVTVQGEVSSAIRETTGQTVNVIGAGRTDAGVHALGQVANFRIEHNLEPERYREALNYHLPDDIRVTRSSEAPMDFHSRFDAKFRRYRYLIGTEPSALFRHYRWFQEGLDFDQLWAAAVHVIGEHDFSAFCVASSRLDNNTCLIEHSRWRRIGPLLTYEIRGNRFLHSMVRSLVGGMVNLARSRPDRNPDNLTLDSFEDIILDPGDRRVVFTAPAHGLYLVSVGY
jgi:tRNA pseudouridine38-40 synthase